jgi:hypothetical protein
VLRRITCASLLLTLLAAAPADAGVTGSVEPATDLVDEQAVRVVVDGLPAQPGGGVALVHQCRAPVVDRAADCLAYGAFRHYSPAGLLRAHVAVHSLLLLDGGSVDCTIDPCAFAVAVDGGTDIAAVIPLDFDPAGPVPDPPAIEAAPTTDLVDGQKIIVHGTGLSPFDDVQMRFCPAGHDDVSCLRLPTGSFSDERGLFTARLHAWAAFHPRGGPTTDCRTTACVLRVEVTYGLATPVEIPVSFVPDTPLLEPEVVVAPHTDLGPRQSVTVRLVGFHDLLQPVSVHQCLGRPGTPPNLRQCDRAHREVIDPRYGVVRLSTRRVMHTAAQGDVDCSVRRCHIWVGRTLEAPSLSSPRLQFHRR